MHFAVEKVKALSGLTPLDRLVLCEYANFYRHTARFDRATGRLAVFPRSQAVADAVRPGTTNQGITKCVRHLRELGFVRVRRGTIWNKQAGTREPRLFVEVYRETYEALGAAPPEYAPSNAVSHDAGTSVSHGEVQPSTLVSHVAGNLVSHYSYLTDSTFKTLSFGEAVADAPGFSADASKVGVQEVNEEVTGGSMKLADKAKLTVAGVAAALAKRPDNDEALPLGALWARHLRRAGFKPWSPDAKGGRHLNLLDDDCRRLGVNLREAIPSMITNWFDYRSPDCPKEPYPWAVRRRLALYVAHRCGALSEPLTGAELSPAAHTPATLTPPPAPPLPHLPPVEPGDAPPPAKHKPSILDKIKAQKAKGA